MSELYGVTMTVKIRITQHGVVCWRSCNILFIRRLDLKFLFLSFDMRKNTILMNFCNHKISGSRRCQSWDSGLAKTAGVPRFGIPGLQSLVTLTNFDQLSCWIWILLEGYTYPKASVWLPVAETKRFPARTTAVPRVHIGLYRWRCYIKLYNRR